MTETHSLSGRFRGRVQGDVDQELTGVATFDRRPNPEDGRWIFLIVLSHDSNEGEGEHEVVLSNSLREALEPGMYEFGDMGRQSFVAIYSHRTEGGSVGSYSAGEGTQDIVDVAPDAVRGGFRFSGSGVSNYNLWAVNGAIEIEGEFDADIDPDTFQRAFAPKPA